MICSGTEMQATVNVLKIRTIKNSVREVTIFS